MSVVAGKVYEDKVVLAADSIIVRGWSKRNENFAKIVNINDMIVGGVGSVQEISLMWRYLQTHKPESPTEKDVLAFAVEFYKWKKELMGDANCSNYFLIAFDGHLFNIENLFVQEIQNYEAIGAGEDFANAALYLGHSPKEAVKVACELCCMVSEPIIEYEMKR